MDRNGAGKSTLLKILSRITPPTEGRIRLRGRVASLLEVGTGFHPELSGRENIYLNGAILGMRRQEIKAKFDEIVAFADAPVAVGFYEVAVSEPNDTDITTAVFDGTIIIAANPIVARWSFTVDTDSTPQVTISSCVFVGWDVFTVMDSDISISSTKFVDGTKMYHGPVAMDACTFVNANTDSDASLIETVYPQLITNSAFMADVGGHALELGTATDTDFAFDGNIFVGYGADGSESAAIYNNSGKAITINLTNTASTPTIRNGGGASTTVLNTVPLTIQVVDENGANVENARCSVYLDSDDTELMNELSLASGQATETYNYLVDVDIYWRVRKHSPAANRYVLAKGTGTIEDTGFSLTVTLRVRRMCFPAGSWAATAS